MFWFFPKRDKREKIGKLHFVDAYYLTMLWSSFCVCKVLSFCQCQSALLMIKMDFGCCRNLIPKTTYSLLKQKAVKL